LAVLLYPFLENQFFDIAVTWLERCRYDKPKHISPIIALFIYDCLDIFESVRSILVFYFICY
jgi:hypothetical protein